MTYLLLRLRFKYIYFQILALKLLKRFLSIQIQAYFTNPSQGLLKKIN